MPIKRIHDGEKSFGENWSAESRSTKVSRALSRSVIALNAILWPINITAMITPEPHDYTLPPSPAPRYMFDGAGNSCDQPPLGMNFMDPKVDEVAKSCLAERSEKVAVVLMGTSDDESDNLRRDIVNSSIDSFEGVLTANVDILQASSEAMKKFHAKHPFCVDEERIENNPARIVDETMHLDEYGYVVAVNPIKVCPRENRRLPKGVSYNENSNRYIDIYDVSNDDLGDPKKRQKIAEVFSHEYGHALLRVHHAGSISNKNGLPVNFEEAPQLVNLNDLIASGTYNEYGDPTNPMGTQAEIFEARLNSFQREKVMWPERALDFSESHQIEVTSEPHYLYKPVEQLHDYALLKLDTPIGLAIKGTDQSVVDHKEFDSLVFDPLLGQGRTLGVQIYLANNKDYSTASFGVIYNFEKTAVNRRLMIGNQSVDLTLYQQSFVVKEIDSER